MVQTAARALNIVNERYTLSQTEWQSKQKWFKFFFWR